MFYLAAKLHPMFRSLTTSLFFSNVFYGLCALALAVENSVQQRLPLNSTGFYMFLFSATVAYYTRAYLHEGKPGGQNPRTLWYASHYRTMLLIQSISLMLALAWSALVAWKNRVALLQMPALSWILLLAFPLAGLAYSGSISPLFPGIRLRRIGWLKPFVIGFVWAGLVTLYPVLFLGLERGEPLLPGAAGAYFFIKNLMFVTVLSIMFDIKDYAADHNTQIKTFVVKAGLRRTIFYILLPLSVAGILAFLVYAGMQQYCAGRILINLIPFLLLLLVAYSMHRRKSILYYLIVIDGLMLIKALFGIWGMAFCGGVCI